MKFVCSCTSLIFMLPKDCNSKTGIELLDVFDFIIVCITHFKLLSRMITILTRYNILWASYRVLTYYLQLRKTSFSQRLMRQKCRKFWNRNSYRWRKKIWLEKFSDCLSLCDQKRRKRFKIILAPTHQFFLNKYWSVRVKLYWAATQKKIWLKNVFLVTTWQAIFIIFK